MLNAACYSLNLLWDKFPSNCLNIKKRTISQTSLYFLPGHNPLPFQIQLRGKKPSRTDRQNKPFQSNRAPTTEKSHRNLKSSLECSRRARNTRAPIYKLLPALPAKYLPLANTFSQSSD